MTDLIKQDKNELMERVVIAGDLSKLEAKDRTAYYMAVCESVGLNPYTKPFELITLNGKMVMYATRTATDQLRQIQKVSVTIAARQKDGDVYTVVAQAKTPDGRTDESTGVVTVGGLRGDQLANAYMKAETKAKRRVTLSIVGLGWLDESESEIPGAQKHTIDIESGEVKSVNSQKAIPPIQSDQLDTSQKKILAQKIKALKEELELTNEEIRAEAHRLFKKEDFKLMNMAELNTLLMTLEEEKRLREKDDTGATLPESDQPWAQENMGPIGT